MTYKRNRALGGVIIGRENTIFSENLSQCNPEFHIKSPVV
jgi:hypothetical protein